MYDDDLVTEKNGVGWHHTGSTIVSVHISMQNIWFNAQVLMSICLLLLQRNAYIVLYKKKHSVVS